MASEWIKLTKDETNEFVYLNLAKASSIFRAMGGGSTIWFLLDAGKNGSVNVKETPEEVFACLMRSKVPKAPKGIHGGMPGG
jgi:hypothetical protein